MRNKKIVFLFISIGFLGSCARKTDSYNFDNTNTVKVDESKTILSRYPTNLTEINDSVIAVINSAQKLSLYNIYSGKNTGNFSTEKIDFDSLIQHTFQKKYEGKRKYSYDRKSAGGLSSNNCQISAFDYSNNNFYIYVNTLSEISYYNDSSELAKYSENDKIKQLKENHTEVNLQIIEFLHFILVVDNKLNLKEIIPLYDKSSLKKDNYSPAYFKGFAIDNDNIIVPIQKDNEAVEKITSNLICDPDFQILAKFNLKNESASDYKLSYKYIDFSKFSMHDFYEVPFSFLNNSGELLFSNGKEICDVESNKKVFSEKNLKANEWIQKFYMKNNTQLIMVTYFLDQKKHPTEFEKSYGVDSLNTVKIKTFDVESSTWVKEKELPLTNLALTITSDKIIYVDKDKQNYYFKYIKYDEK
ncbi:MAG: hypothetical protein ACXVPY_01265 [Bacteroidia bacterium]